VLIYPSTPPPSCDSRGINHADSNTRSRGATIHSHSAQSAFGLSETRIAAVTSGSPTLWPLCVVERRHG